MNKNKSFINYIDMCDLDNIMKWKKENSLYSEIRKFIIHELKTNNNIKLYYLYDKIFNKFKNSQTPYLLNYYESMYIENEFFTTHIGVCEMRDEYNFPNGDEYYTYNNLYYYINLNGPFTFKFYKLNEKPKDNKKIIILLNEPNSLSKIPRVPLYKLTLSWIRFFGNFVSYIKYKLKICNCNSSEILSDVTNEFPFDVQMILIYDLKILINDIYNKIYDIVIK